MSNEEIGLRMGAIAPPIAQQLSEQGFVLPGVERYQEQSDRISHLNVGQLLTDSEAHRARQRLFKKIMADVKRQKEG
jgi:hypothetical protein